MGSLRHAYGSLRPVARPIPSSAPAFLYMAPPMPLPTRCWPVLAVLLALPRSRWPRATGRSPPRAKRPSSGGWTGWRRIRGRRELGVERPGPGEHGGAGVHVGGPHARPRQVRQGSRARRWTSSSAAAKPSGLLNISDPPARHVQPRPGDVRAGPGPRHDDGERPQLNRVLDTRAEADRQHAVRRRRLGLSRPSASRTATT